ncbi:MAG: thioesterase domain-containing protein, partial [Byssovorax sp.]
DLAESDVGPLLGESLSLAALNGPTSVVVSGPEPAIANLEARLSGRGAASRRLRTSHAFHSASMDPILAAFTAEVRKVALHAPQIPYLSSVTGGLITAAEATDPAYWARHLRAPVRFSPGLVALAEGRTLLEVGPGRSLTTLARHHGFAAISTLGAPGGRASDLEGLLGALGQLWISGARVDWAALRAGEVRRRVPLPTYPFERLRHWIELPTAIAAAEALDLAAEAAWLSVTEAEITASLAIRPIESYPGLTPALDALCSRKVVDFLIASGVRVEKGQTSSRRALLGQTGILPKFARLFDAMLAMLAEDGIAQITGDEVRFLESASALSPDVELRRRLADHPGFQGLITFLDHCSATYADSLTGKIEAIGVLYPGGSTRVIEESQRATVEYRSERIYISLLVAAVTRIVEASAGRRIRILEVGGGQGFLTWPLVEALAKADVEYHFTDLGKVFVDDARRRASESGLDANMRFGTFDASADPASQGYDLRSFDLVVAYNVLHATRDVVATVRQLATLLVPGGAMAWVEVVKARRWDTLTWGLAEGWWYYDDAVRTESPLLALDQWVDIAREQGFLDVEAYPRTPTGRAGSDHGLILARGRQAAFAPAPRREARAPRASHGPAPSVQPRPELRTPHVAPRDETERRIAAICAELLGVESLGVHDDFFELGADSLITLRITDRIRQELGREVPAHAAFRGSTVERMARALDQRADPAPSSPLVAIQPGGTRPPLFFVHPAAGIVFPYFALARELGPDQPFYGLQARGLDGREPPDRTIEEMARTYVDALRAVQPRGPYFLGGFSFGCLVAFEMAQILRRAGETPGLVVLVDEPAPVLGHRPSAALMARLFITGVGRTIWPHLHDYFYLRGGSPKPELPSLKDLSRLRPDAELWQSILARSTMANFVPAESRLLALRQPAMRPMFDLFLLHVRQTLAYRPEAYPHGVTVFQATSLGGKYDADPSMGWRVLAAGGVEVHKIPGEHLELLRPPHVRVLAAKLNDCISRATLR